MLSPLPDPTIEPTITVERAGEILGLGRRAAYVQANAYLETGGREGIPALRFGRAIRVPSAALLALVGLPVGDAVSRTEMSAS